MSNIKEQVDFILKGGTVHRYHTRPLIHQQNNAEHQFGVASIAALIDPYLGKSSLLHMLWHDSHEGQTGDIPYYSKLRWPGLKQVLNVAEAELNAQFPIIPELNNPVDKITLKIAEYFDVLIFCSKETYLGNTEFKVTIQECVDLITDLANKYPDTYYESLINTMDLLNLLMVEYEEKTKQKWYSQSITVANTQTKSNPKQEAIQDTQEEKYQAGLALGNNLVP